MGNQAHFDVHLWPKDAEWECTCDAGERGCAHAVAALLALAGGLDKVRSEPIPARLCLELRTDGSWLRLAFAMKREGLRSPLPTYPPRDLIIDEEVERLRKSARDWAGDRVPTRLYHQLLAALTGAEEVSLDGQPVSASTIPLDVMAVVEPVGPGFRVRLQDPPEVTRSWDGDPPILLAKGILRPRGLGRLSKVQQHQLRDGLFFHAHELPLLTAEWLPALEKAVRVERRDGVPAAQNGGIELRLELMEGAGVLEVCPRIVYGDPPVAELQGEILVPLGGLQALPPRNRGREKDLQDELERVLAMRPGQRLHLSPESAARFVRDKLPKWKGAVVNRAAAEGFKVKDKALKAQARWNAGNLQVSFTDGEAWVGPERVLDSWRRGESLVALPQGGFAPLPIEWMDAHGEALLQLMEAAPAGGTPPHLAPLAADVIEATGAPVPPDLRGLLDLFRDVREGRAQAVVEPPKKLSATLRHYQVQGQAWVRHLLDHHVGAVLADDMGLGKTVQAISALVADAGKGTTLVVAPTSVLRNWQDELSRFGPTLKVGLMHGPKRDDVVSGLPKGKHDVVVTSYALLRRDLEALKKIEFRTVVLDEAQAIKNADSQTARSARSLRSRRRLALTGTPIENRPAELWSIMDFLNPGFFGARARFEERLGTPAAAGDPRAVAALRDRVRPFILRRTKEQVAPELPPRTEVVIRCPLSDGQRTLYEAVRQAALQELGPRKGAEGGRRPRGKKGKEEGAKEGAGNNAGTRRIQVLAALLRLRQVACHAALVPGGDPSIPSGKMDLLLESLQNVIDEGHKALVFSQWTSLLDLVEPLLREAGIGFVRLDGSTRDRAAVVAEFQGEGGPPVFLISLKAGGTGLNLTAADYVFHLDPWWNPAIERQATDRAHRIGQTRPVIAWKLVAEGTVEERILELQAGKKALADALLEGAGGVDSLDLGVLEELLETA
jgi:superfamily II DNA or RNA helicase